MATQMDPALDALLDDELEQSRDRELAQLEQLWREGLELEKSWDQAKTSWDEVVTSLYPRR
jgi:hypothetical protein